MSGALPTDYAKAALVPPAAERDLIGEGTRLARLESFAERLYFLRAEKHGTTSGSAAQAWEEALRFEAAREKALASEKADD